MADAGRLIAFEGVEGAGKSTQLKLTAAALRERGYTVIETREPGGTPLGVELRRLLMHVYDHPPASFTELLLYLADRAQHVAEVIAPALAAGHVVLSDRFSGSTIAYQGYARGLDLPTVIHLDEIARQGVVPDFTVLLDCPVDAGLQRAHGDDRFHRERLAFHQRVRQGFLAMAAQTPKLHRVVDATAPPQAVQAQVMQAVLECLNAK